MLECQLSTPSGGRRTPRHQQQADEEWVTRGVMDMSVEPSPEPDLGPSWHTDPDPALFPGEPDP